DPAAASLGDQLHRDLGRVGEVRGGCRAVNRANDEVERRLLRFMLAQTGAADLGATDARDRGTEHARKRGIATTDVDARDTSMPVGDRAERDVNRPPAHEMERLRAVAGRPNVRRARLLAPVDAHRSPYTELDACIRCELTVRLDADAEDDE